MRHHKALCAALRALLAAAISLAALCVQPQMRVLSSRSRTGRRYEIVLELDWLPPTDPDWRGPLGLAGDRSPKRAPRRVEARMTR